LCSVAGLCADSGDAVIVTPEKTIELSVRFARTPEEWDRGLQDIPVLKENESMGFLFPREGIYTFTPKGVRFPIDILLINKSGRIIHIFEELSGDRYYAYPLPVLAALETSGGFAASHGIMTGNHVQFREMDFVPREPARDRGPDIETAVGRLKTNIRNYPDDPVSKEQLGTFYLGVGEDEKAEMIFQDLLKEKETPERLNWLGMARANRRQWQEAEQLFQRARDMDPYYHESYKNLIRLYRFQQNLAGVTAQLAGAVERHPDLLEIRLDLARIYLETGEIAAARTVLLSAPEPSDSRAMLARVMGDVYLRLGDHSRAADEYLMYLQQCPYDLHAADLRAFITVHKIRKAQLEQ